MKIAVITGASSGIGKQFALQIKGQAEFDELWLIARNEARLKETGDECGVPTRVFSIDLTDTANYSAFLSALEEVKPEITMLINCSGFGKFEAFTDTRLEQNLSMVDLNCKAVIAMTTYCLPYMNEGAKILNVASVAAYQPIPYINVYAATKSFVLYFSRALNVELKKRGIKVLAVCPFWTKTAFFDTAIEKQGIVKKYAVMYDPADVVKKAYKDAKKKKDVSIYGKYARFQCLLTKLVPHKTVMNVWLSQQDLK